MKFTTFWVLAVSCLLSFFSPQVYAIPVDLSKFDLIDENDISFFGTDNSSALIREDTNPAAPYDPSVGPVSLLDFDLRIPLNALSLSFDYELVIAPYNEDYFDFYFGDLSAPSNSYGGHNEGTENLIYSGTINIALSSHTENTQPIVFALNYGFDDGYTYEELDAMGYPTFVGNEYASTLTITNVKINPVPEPATLLLLGSGLLGIIGYKKRKISGAT